MLAGFRGNSASFRKRWDMLPVEGDCNSIPYRVSSRWLQMHTHRLQSSKTGVLNLSCTVVLHYANQGNWAVDTNEKNQLYLIARQVQERHWAIQLCQPIAVAPRSTFLPDRPVPIFRRHLTQRTASYPTAPFLAIPERWSLTRFPDCRRLMTPRASHSSTTAALSSSLICFLPCQDRADPEAPLGDCGSLSHRIMHSRPSAQMRYANAMLTHSKVE